MAGNKLMVGLWRLMIQVPPSQWHKQVGQGVKRFRAEQGFMTPEHRRVHHHVVRELPGAAKPLTPEDVARGVGLTPARVGEILDDLEKHQTFVWRDPQGAVTWAYPVTVEPTPHRLTFSTGECCFAA
ncbi:MAG: hypothetical protein KJ621_08100 [Proteobacteria bacterium]|nr:hypothetical protein [Pseudomonadota bacterium]